MLKPLTPLFLLALIGACQTNTVETPRPLQRDAYSTYVLQGRSDEAQAALPSLIEEAEGHPLGSEENPVRVNMPLGQKAYLGRLRCASGDMPTASRIGSAGEGVFGSIVDVFEVDCGEASPGRVAVWMDMYHPHHKEDQPPPGFTMSEKTN